MFSLFLRTRILGAATLLASLVALVAGCAEERPAIDRVQPNAIDKTLFVDEWYYGRTVVDVPASDGFTFVGNTDYSGLTRITWDVQEDFLYARRSTELIRHADDKDDEGLGYRGEVVAAFRIDGHFDIVKAYNSTTGEELNVIEENYVDRPWYDRAYMRVDWSENLVHNYQLDFESTSLESVAYYVQEIDPVTGERNADAPVFTDDGDYFDVTSKIFARAGTTELDGYGTIPVCWLRGEEFAECGAGEYSIRHSFMKIGDRQYEPLKYKGKSTEVFGYFTSDRMVYDDHEGIREQNRERYLNRHNLWVRSFDAEGQAIPYAERELKPVVYHVNRDFPDDLRDVAKNVGDQWNRVFTDTVVALGYEPGDQRAFIVCPHNPIAEGDAPECGQPGDSPRLGDIRYSFMAYVPGYMTYGLLGLGPSNSDPVTGEIVSGMGYVYHHNNLAAYRVQEMVELLNGNRAADDFIDGVDLTEWVNDVGNGDEGERRLFSLEDAEYMTGRLAKGWASRAFAAERAVPTAEDIRFQKEHGFDAWIEPQLESLYRRGFHNAERNAPEARLANLEDTYIEELLLDDEVLMAGGRAPGSAVEPHHIVAASVARGGLGALASKRSQLREQYAASRNMYLPEMADDALMGLAREFKDLSSDEVYERAREMIYTAVLAHEVGHSLGLMHNFGGSDDAINYADTYWQLRDDGEVGPRLVDPLSDEEIDGKIYNYAYSSVMDYAGRYTIDGAGIGKYDRAAILYGYAQKVEVFEDLGDAEASELRDWFETDGDVISFGTRPSALHYTTLYHQMGDGLYADDNRRLVDVSTLDESYGTAEIEGEEYTRVPYIYCSHSRYNLGDSCLTRDFGADAQERMKNILDDLNSWYILRSFPRGIIGADNYNYVNRYYGRIYNRLKKWNDIYGLYADLLPLYYDEADLQGFLMDPVNGWGGKTWAVQNAFNYLMQTVLMPDVGVYGGPYLQADGTDMMMLTGRGTLDLGVSEARYYSTSWGDGDRECGYTWWECLHHVGFYLDKIMAIEALTDTETNFVARSTPEDLRQWEVGYFTTFSEQILKVNAAIMGGDWSRVGPYQNRGTLEFPNYAGDLNSRHNNPVDPFATFSVQLYWQVLGQARFPKSYDQSFVDESRIYVEGSGRAPDFPPERLATYFDPTTAYTYVAVRNEQRRSAGAATLDRAAAMTALSIYCDDSGVTAASADDCQPIDPASQEYVTFLLLDYLELIRVMSDLTPMLEFGDPYDL